MKFLPYSICAPRISLPAPAGLRPTPAGHAPVGADIIRPPDCARRVCDAPIPAARLPNSSPVQGELSAEPTEGLESKGT